MSGRVVFSLTEDQAVALRALRRRPCGDTVGLKPAALAALERKGLYWSECASLSETGRLAAELMERTL
jgi:hypothetical protein